MNQQKKFDFPMLWENLFFLFVLATRIKITTIWNYDTDCKKEGHHFWYSK